MEKVIKVVKVETEKKGKATLITLHYEGKGGVWTMRALAGKLDTDSRQALHDAKAGDMLKTTQEKVGEYNNLVKVEKASAGSSSTKTYTPNKPRNDDNMVGIKVGAARNQAIAFLAATKGSKFTLDDVDSVAFEIVERQAKQEEVVKNKGNPATPEAINDELSHQNEKDDDFDF